MHPRLLYTKTSRSSSAINPQERRLRAVISELPTWKACSKTIFFLHVNFTVSCDHSSPRPACRRDSRLCKNTCRRKGTKPPAHFPRIWEILSCSNIRHSRTAGRLSWKLSRQRYPYKQFRSLYENDSGSKTCQTSLQNNRNIRCARKRKIYRFQIDWHAKTHVPKPQAAAIAKWIFCLNRNPSWHRQTSSDSCANGIFRTPPYRRSKIWQRNHRSYEFRTIFDKTISGRTTSSLRLQANISSSQNRKRDGISDLKLHLS